MSIPVKISSARTRAVLVLAMVFVVLLVCGGVSVAGAAAEVGCSSCRPWWHLDAVSAPASTPGGEGRVIAEASDLGDAYVNGIVNHVTIVDKLPPGMVATSVYGSGGGSSRGREDTKFFMVCSASAGTVTCTFSGPLLAYERLLVDIAVKVQPGAGTGLNEVSISGGGAPPAVLRRALALGVAPGPFGVENYEMTPEEEGGAVDTQAGSHPFQLTTTFALNTETVPGDPAQQNTGEPFAVQPLGLAKDLRFNLPPGLLGNPTPIPQCSTYTFVSATAGVPGVECPADSAVGVATVMIANPKRGSLVPWTETNPLYNLTRSVGEPAKFGFRTDAGSVTLDTSVRTGGDYGVVVSSSNIVDQTALTGSQVTFWGDPSDPRHDSTRGKACLDEFDLETEPPQWELSCAGQGTGGQPFLIMPTSCTGPLHTGMEADSWEQAGTFVPKEYLFQNAMDEPYGLDGCNHLSFEPSISVAPDGQQASTPTGLTVNVHVGQEASLNPAGLADAQVKNTTVTLPAGVGLNPAGADGLSACSESQIALESAGEQSCPESAKVATVKIKTPLLPNELEGAAYLAAQNANPFGSLVALYIVAKDPVSGVLVKLAGQVTPNPVTGQLVSTFTETPQLPFENLSLHFFGGSRAPLGTPALCGGYTSTASITPWSGNQPVNSSSEFQITSGPNGAPCANPLPFAPSLTAGSSNIQAGAFTPFTMTMSREDGNQNLKAILLHMPPGLSGTLSHVALCGEPQADAGTCGPETLIGETTVSVGLGGNPYTVTGGKVYITGPYEGAPFGLSIVNPANAGPFHLGNVIVRAKIEVDPHTAALTITSDDTGPYAIPQYIDGIPLQIKHVNVTIDRPGFTFNPTNCSSMSITGTLSSIEGATSALAVPFQATNCATLKFQPKFAVSTSGKTSKANGASLAVKLTYPNVPQGTDANITKVKVDLPKQLPSRLTTLQKACTNAQFEANPAGCPPASVVGHARAITPLLPVPLEGPAYFVSHGGEAFPSLIIVLQGYGVTLDLVGTTFISKAGITSSTFKTVPDAPVGSFELTLPEGKYSALAANGDLCTSKLAMPTAFVAQNGMEIHESTPIGVTGCAKPKALTRAQKLAAALKVCKKKAKSKRAACRASAQKRYGPLAKKKGKSKGKRKA